MDIRNLMIGDWVRIKTYCISDKSERTIVYQYVKVAEINRGCITIERNNDNKEPFLICDNANIEPIPLTPEIMKKSGFKANPECDYIYTDDDPDIVIDMFEPNNPMYKKTLNEYMNEVGISLLQSNYLFGPLDAAIIIQAYYVHELQHFIKACGIKKEIIL